MTHVMMLGILVMTGSAGQYQHKENLNICGYYQWLEHVSNLHEGKGYTVKGNK
jgi:hypothetical protein